MADLSSEFLPLIAGFTESDLGGFSFPSEFLPLGAIAGDVTPPTISNLTPTPGTTINSGDVIAFDVTDLSPGLAKVFIGVSFGGSTEVILVHNGDVFVGSYTGSIRTAITNGYHYQVQKTGGWPAGSSITMTPFALDKAGNENA